MPTDIVENRRYHKQTTIARLDYLRNVLGAVKDWAILADQKGPNRYNAMATRMSPAPTEF